MYRFVVVLLMYFVTPLVAFGQPRPNEGQQLIFYEAINLIATDSTKSRVDILYRIDLEFFIAVRNTDPTFLRNFKRRGEVLIELVNSDGVSKARDINRFDIGADSPETEPGSKQWYQGIASFTVAPGTYAVVFEVDDLESRRKFLDRKRTIQAKRFSSLEASSPMLLNWPADASHRLSPQNFGGNLLFGTEAAMYVQVHVPNADSLLDHVSYSIEATETAYEKAGVVLAETVTVSTVTQSFSLKPMDPGETIGYIGNAVTENPIPGLLIPFASIKLPLRPYELTLTIRQGKSETKVRHPFRLVWPDMPQSLRDIDFALEALRHITTTDQLDSLTKGSRETRRKNLETFWREKDQTPNSAINEVMVEYYRRVDHAVKTFGTLKEADGSKTDRGRIYILHGPPTRTERKLDPAKGFQEIWTYEELNKQFVFIDRSRSGNYTLMSTQSL